MSAMHTHVFSVLLLNMNETSPCLLSVAVGSHPFPGNPVRVRRGKETRNKRAIWSPSPPNRMDHFQKNSDQHLPFCWGSRPFRGSGQRGVRRPEVLKGHILSPQINKLARIPREKKKAWEGEDPSAPSPGPEYQLLGGRLTPFAVAFPVPPRSPEPRAQSTYHTPTRPNHRNRKNSSENPRRLCRGREADCGRGRRPARGQGGSRAGHARRRWVPRPGRRARLCPPGTRRFVGSGRVLRGNFSRGKGAAARLEVWAAGVYTAREAGLSGAISPSSPKPTAPLTTTRVTYRIRGEFTGPEDRDMAILPTPPFPWRTLRPPSSGRTGALRFCNSPAKPP